MVRCPLLNVDKKIYESVEGYIGYWRLFCVKVIVPYVLCKKTNVGCNTMLVYNDPYM
jgi:hypothetical protein